MNFRFGKCGLKFFTSSLSFKAISIAYYPGDQLVFHFINWVMAIQWGYHSAEWQIYRLVDDKR